MKQHIPSLLIILCMGFFIAWQCRGSKIAKLEQLEESRLFQEKMDRHTQMANRAGARADSLQASFENRRKVDSLALKGLAVRNKAMSETVQKLRIPVQVTIDTMQALGTFVKAYDSLLAGKNAEIQQLELRHAAQIIDLEGAIKERGIQVMEEAKKTEAWRTAAVESEKDLKKQKRRTGFWKFLAAVGITTAGVIAATSQ